MGPLAWDASPSVEAKVVTPLPTKLVDQMTH